MTPHFGHQAQSPRGSQYIRINSTPSCWSCLPKVSSNMMQQWAVDQSAPRPQMPPAPEGERRPYGDDAASRCALQPRQIFKAHRDAAESARERDLEAGGGAGSAPGDQLRETRICKIIIISLSLPCGTQKSGRTVYARLGRPSPQCFRPPRDKAGRMRSSL